MDVQELIVSPVRLNPFFPEKTYRFQSQALDLSVSLYIKSPPCTTALMHE